MWHLYLKCTQNHHVKIIHTQRREAGVTHMPVSGHKFNDRAFIVIQQFHGLGIALDITLCCQRYRFAALNQSVFIGISLKRNHCRLTCLQTQAVTEEDDYVFAKDNYFCII